MHRAKAPSAVMIPAWPNGLELTGDGGAAARVRCSDVLGPLGELTLEPFSQELFEQRLIGNITLDRQDLEMADHGLRQPQRDGPERGTEVRKGATLGGSPVDVVGGISLGPKGSLLVLRTEDGNLLTFCFAHRSAPPCVSCPGPK